MATATGVTAPSIYRHFPDKDALLFAVVEREFADFDRRIRAGAVRGRGDPFKALSLAGKAYLRFGREHPAAYRVLFGKIGGAVITSDDQEHPGRASFMTLVGLIRDCLGEQASEQEVFEVAVEAWAFLHGLVDLGRSCPTFAWPDHDTLVERWNARLRQSVAAG